MPAVGVTYHPAPLSPRPWATMMVAVCRLSAGTTIGARPAILGTRRYIERGIGCLLVSPTRILLSMPRVGASATRNLGRLDQAPLPPLHQTGVQAPIKSQTSSIHLTNRQFTFLSLHLAWTFALLLRSLPLHLVLL